MSDKTLYIFTFSYEDGRTVRLGADEACFELMADEFEKPWVYVVMPDGGLGFVKTEGLEWATITKDIK